jgi:uncharacterized repeat protein (TIGR03803 family)
MFAPLLKVRNYVPLREASQCQNHDFGNLSTNACESDRAIRANFPCSPVPSAPGSRPIFRGPRRSISLRGPRLRPGRKPYGTTLGGGAEDAGVVFKLAPNSKSGWSETVLHDFRDRPGALPVAGVVFDTAGNLFGTTDGEKGTTFGSVFEQRLVAGVPSYGVFRQREHCIGLDDLPAQLPWPWSVPRAGSGLRP